MTTENDEPRDDGASAPLPYKYRYKYLHKYGDESDPEQGKDDENKDGKKHDEKDDGEKKDDKKEEDKKDDKDDPKAKRKKAIVLSIIAAVFLLAGLTWLLLYIFVFTQREKTDDAYVKG